jgi:hypothetical protein
MPDADARTPAPEWGAVAGVEIPESGSIAAAGCKIVNRDLG